ncbi:Ecm30p [Nakaseomyces bracarensis]|uniref:Ecm30p n=1 Tax=Nakaseomyces bracarensis TaxID=273131 RepID=UPI003870EE6E
MGNTDSKLNSLYKEHLFKLAKSDSTSLDNTENGVIRLFNSDYSTKELFDVYNNGLKFVNNGDQGHLDGVLNEQLHDPALIDENLFTDYFNDFLRFDLQRFENFNNLITKDELRVIYKNNRENYLNLMRFVIMKIIIIPSLFSSLRNTTQLNKKLTQLLTCIKILTKLVPIYFEGIAGGDRDILWNNNMEALCGEQLSIAETIIAAPTSPVKKSLDKSTDDLSRPLMGRPLGAKLIDACLKLLFIENFTVTTSHSTSQKTGDVTLILWENGINTYETAYYTEYPHLDANRLQIINLLLSLVSSDLYHSVDLRNITTVDSLASENKFLEYIRYEAKEHNIICMTASIINLYCRHASYYKQETTNPYKLILQDHQREQVTSAERQRNETASNTNNISNQMLPELRSKLVLSSIQFLNIIMTKEISKSGKNDDNQINAVMGYLSTLQREFDLKLVLTSIIRVFKLPIDAAIDEESSLFTFSTASPRKKNISSHSRNSSVSEMKRTNSNSSNLSRMDGHNGSSAINSHVENNVASSSLPPIPPLLCQSLVLLVNLMKTNKLMKNQFADKFASKFIVFAIYYLKYYNNNQDYAMTLIPLLNTIALYLTSKPLVLLKMLDTFNPNYYTNKLPNTFKLSSGNINNITYRDFSVIQLTNIANSDIKNNIQPNPILFELLFNLIPVDPLCLNSKDENNNEDLMLLSRKKSSTTTSSLNKNTEKLSYNASLALLQLISKIGSKSYLTSYSNPRFTSSISSTPPYLLSPGFKLDLLALLLRSICIYVVFNFEEALNLIFALARHKNVILQLSENLSAISRAVKPGAINYQGQNRGLNIKDYYRLEELSYSSINFGRHRFGDDPMRRSSSPFGNKTNGYTNSNPDLDSDEQNNSPYLVLNKPVVREHSVDDLTSLSSFRKTSVTNQDYENKDNGEKTYQMLEYVDVTNDPIIALSNEEMYFELRPKWPLGITIKSKVKETSKNELSKSWAGFDSMLLLTKLVKLLLFEFPEISTIKNTDYYSLLGKIFNSKDKIDTMINDNIPLYLKSANNYARKKLCVDDETNFVNYWFYVICWADIFDTHSNPYTKVINDANKTEELLENTGNSIAEPSSPTLERWNSNNSNLSRTNSNNSSFMSYLFQQNQQQSTTPSDSQGISRNNDNHQRHSSNTKKSNNENNSAFSLFKFSWTGFNKNNNDYDIIKEEDDKEDLRSLARKNGTSNKESTMQINHVSALDVSLLKSSIWAGTDIKIFKIEAEEKEEFSLLDMTSTFFKKLKFNNSSTIQNTWDASAYTGSAPLSTVPFAARNPMF